MNDDIFTKERNFNLGINWSTVALFLALVFIIYATALLFPIVKTYVREITPKAEAAQRDYLDERLDNLAECESQHRPWIEIVDTNGELSYGIYQFQAKTFVSYMQEYGLAPHAEPAELMNFIKDPVMQRRLTREMLEDGLYYHWKACSERYGWLVE